jgi:hypothetical protein
MLLTRFQNVHHELRNKCIGSADEPVARVTKFSREKIFLGTRHSLLSHFSPPTSLYIYIYIYIYIYMNALRLNMIRITMMLGLGYIFLYKTEAVRS